MYSYVYFNMCIYIFMYIYIYLCIYIYLYVHVHICSHVVSKRFSMRIVGVLLRRTLVVKAIPKVWQGSVGGNGCARLMDSEGSALPLLSKGSSLSRCCV